MPKNPDNIYMGYVRPIQERVHFANTGDWPEDIQPYIDKICSLDGDPSGLSDLDIRKAQTEAGLVPPDVIRKILPLPQWRYDPIQLVRLRNRFSDNNPIHEMIGAEFNRYDIVDSEMVSTAYDRLHQVLERVKDYSRANPYLSPKEKLKLIYKVIKDIGIELKPQLFHALFTENLYSKKLDCDTSSLVVAAVAYEMKWPVKLVYIPNHIFVRWAGPGEPFNIDYGNINPDSVYESKLSVPKGLIAEGVFACEVPEIITLLLSKNNGLNSRSNPTNKRFLEWARKNSGSAFAQYYLGNLETDAAKAEKHYEEAIKLEPQSYFAYAAMGIFKQNQAKYNEAVLYYNKGIDISIMKEIGIATSIYYFMAIAYMELGEFEKSRESLLKTKDDIDDYAPLFGLLGFVESKLGNTDEAITNYRKSLASKRRVEGFSHTRTYYDLGMIYLRLGKSSEARACFREGIIKPTGKPLV